MQNIEVTIVVVPRERFSCTQESLESIYEYTDFPFKLVYVDGNSPAKVRHYLECQAQDKGFQLIRTDYYLSPNHARNIGLRQVDTKYVVFVDNDVVVSPGWLQALVDCAESTSATVVSPLTCVTKPLHEKIHYAGGECHIITDNQGKRRLRERMYKQGKLLSDLSSELARAETELAEFHCMLIRTEIFERVGYLDENLMNTREHLDFCMTVIEAGGSVYIEADSLVTYVPGPPLEWTDIHYYMLRWSDAWTLSSLNHFCQKWNLTKEGGLDSQFKYVGWRRRDMFTVPLSRRLSFGMNNKPLTKILNISDRWLNRYLTTSYARKQPKPVQQTITAKTDSKPAIQLSQH